MKDVYRAIYLRAREYWNTRFNDFHVPLVYEQALRLLLAYPKADRDVVIPAVLLHDLGWKSIPGDQQLRAFGIIAEDEALQRFHETEGVRIAGDILSATGFDPQRRETILQIIDGHDTRLQPLSLEDSLVKDADKLWRFTLTAVDIDHHRFSVPLAAWVDLLGQRIGPWMVTDRGRDMAHAALADLRSAVEAGWMSEQSLAATTLNPVVHTCRKRLTGVVTRGTPSPIDVLCITGYPADWDAPARRRLRPSV